MGRRKHLAVIGALCVRVKTGRLLLYLGFFPEDRVDGELIRHFVEGLLERLRGAVTLVWDGLGAHLSEEMEKCLDGHRRLRLSLFRAHCPELNPVEWLWRWLKWDKLANDAPAHAGGVGLDRRGVLRAGQSRPGSAPLVHRPVRTALGLVGWIGRYLYEDQ